jgi:hypothetical protein
MVEAVSPIHQKRGERAVRHRHAPDEAAIDVKADCRGICINPETPGPHEAAVLGRRLDSHLVYARVDVEQRGPRARPVWRQVVVGVGGTGHAERGHYRRRRDTGRRRRRVVQRALAQRCASLVYVVCQVLAGIADDAQAVGVGIEVDAK